MPRARRMEGAMGTEDGIEALLQRAGTESFRRGVDWALERVKDLPKVTTGWFNQSDAAAYVRMSRPRFNLACRAGRGPKCVTYGRAQWRTKAAWLDEWVMSGGAGENGDAPAA